MKLRHCLLLALAAPVHAGEIVPSRIPPAAKWQLHADLDAMRSSDTGKAVIARIEEDHGAKLRAFKRMFSIHPLADLRGITLYGDGKPDHAVALIDGKFNRAHLEDIVKAADDYTATTRSGHEIHHWNDKGKPQHAAFADDGLLVFSHQEDLLHQALDLLKANAPAEADPFLKADGGTPLIAASARFSEIEMPGDEARLLRMADTVRVAATEHDGRFAIRIAVDADNATSADRLLRILDGIVAFAQASDPKLDGLDLRADFAGAAGQPELTAALSLPVAEWIALMEKVAAEEAAKKSD